MSPNVRPRVRREDESGQQEEVKLASYQAANDPAALTASILQALSSGVSTREMQKVKPGAPGVSKSWKVLRLLEPFLFF